MHSDHAYFSYINVHKKGYSQAIIQLLLYKCNPTIKYFVYLWLKLKESLAVDSFSCLFKVYTYLFVPRIGGGNMESKGPWPL